MRRSRKEDPYLYDSHLKTEFSASSLIGVDEAGRGSLAGPVVVASVILNPENPIEGLDDSKKLSHERRVELFQLIIKNPYHVVAVSVDLIEKINILGATMNAMRFAVGHFDNEIQQGAFAIVDGNIKIPEIPDDKQVALVKADAKSACVAAASILAKVSRDRIMEAESEKYPGYGFNKNKGYGSPEHIEAIRTLGLCPLHRPSFCKKFLKVESSKDTLF